MLSKKYSLQKPSDVRELYRLGNTVHLLLALIYAVNDLQSKAGYAYEKSKEEDRDPGRGQPRPPGCLTHISQKGLFLFSDMYTEEALLNLIVNETMFQEEAP